MLGSISKEAFLQTVMAEGRNLLFIVAPNFEDRSRKSTEWLAPQLSEKSQSPTRNIFFSVISLQGQHPQEILDAIKAENVSYVKQILSNYHIPHKHRVLPFPIPDERAFLSDVEAELTKLGPNVDLVIDLSCFPRRVLFHLLNFLFPVGAGSRLFKEDLKVENVYFLYTWAEAYPAGLGPEFVGDIRSYLSGKSFREILDDTDEAHVCIFTSGTGYDANLAYEQTQSGIRATVSRTLFVVINKDNVRRSLKHVCDHHRLISDARSQKNERIEYVFSMPDAAARLQDIADEQAERHKSGHSLFAVAPFGPKPLGLIAYLGVARYRERLREQRGSRSTADILYLADSQYMSVYSIGAKDISVFTVPRRSLHGATEETDVSQ